MSNGNHGGCEKRVSAIGWRRRFALGVGVLALALQAGPFAEAGTFASLIREQATNVRFSADAQAGGTDYRCLGAGSRHVLGFKVYAVAFCMDPAQVEQPVREYVRSHYPRASGKELARALERDQQFFDTLAAAPGDKLVVLKFLRDIPRERLAGAFRNSARRYMPNESAEKLVAALPNDVRAGEVALLHSHGDDLVLQMAAEQQTIENDPSLTGGLWRIWLGSDTPTPNLKDSIAERALQLL